MTEAVQYINNTMNNQRFIAVHLRIGSDWVSGREMGGRMWKVSGRETGGRMWKVSGREMGGRMWKGDERRDVQCVICYIC